MASCIDCGAPITEEARKLNPSELWCLACEVERRRRISAQFAEISKSFEQPAGSDGER